MKERWKIVPDGVPAVKRNCSKCKEKREFINSMKFRVNANGKLIDVWLVYRCEKCSNSWNMAIYERTPVESIPREEYAGFLNNDRGLAEAFGRRYDLLAKNKAETVPAGGGYRVKTERSTVAQTEEENAVVSNGNNLLLIELEMPFPVTLRLDGLLADRLGVSRSMIKRWCGQGIVFKLNRGNTTRQGERIYGEKVRNGMIIGIRDMPIQPPVS